MLAQVRTNHASGAVLAMLEEPLATPLEIRSPDTNLKVLYGLSRARTVSLCKGVHREVKSEGSKWQNLVVTNRNLIVGLYNLGNLAIDRIAQ